MRWKDKVATKRTSLATTRGDVGIVRYTNPFPDFVHAGFGAARLGGSVGGVPPVNVERGWVRWKEATETKRMSQPATLADVGNMCYAHPFPNLTHFIFRNITHSLR